MRDEGSFCGKVLHKRPQIFRHLFLLSSSKDHAFIDIFPKIVNSFLFLLLAEARLLSTVVEHVLIDSASVLPFRLFELTVIFVLFEQFEVQTLFVCVFQFEVPNDLIRVVHFGHLLESTVIFVLMIGTHSASASVFVRFPASFSSHFVINNELPLL